MVMVVQCRNFADMGEEGLFRCGRAGGCLLTRKLNGHFQSQAVTIYLFEFKLFSMKP